MTASSWRVRKGGQLLSTPELDYATWKHSGNYSHCWQSTTWVTCQKKSSFYLSHLESCTELERELESSGINHDIPWGKTLQCNLGFMEAEETQTARCGQGVPFQPVPSNGSALEDKCSCCCCTPPGAHTASTDDTLRAPGWTECPGETWEYECRSPRPFCVLPSPVPRLPETSRKEGYGVKERPVYAHTAAADDVWCEDLCIHPATRGGLCRHWHKHGSFYLHISGLSHFYAH